MENTTLNTSDTEVSKELEAEINAIKTETGSTEAVTYAPEAYTREGRVD